MDNACPELAKIARAYCPVVVLHPRERFFPCTPSFYLERCQLSQRQSDGSPTRVVIPREELTTEKVTKATAAATLGDGYFLDLVESADRVGLVSGPLSSIPILCHMKRVLLDGDVHVLEISYMFFFAYSGPYDILGKEKGAHDGDWEHITVRCHPDTGRLIAVYYSAHRHGNGTWLPGPRVPFHDETGRLVVFCALNGHGMFPKAGRNLRVFGFANDVTSVKGRRWCSRRCVIVVPPGQRGTDGPLRVSDLPVVSDRGTKFRQPSNGQMQTQQQLPPVIGGFSDGLVAMTDVQVDVQEIPALQWPVQWGTATNPSLQRWFTEAEHPTGSNSFKRFALPCVRV